MSVERWRDIQGYDGMYQVSDLGRVRSLTRDVEVGQPHNRHMETRTGRILKQIYTRGYPRVALCRGGKAVLALVHRLVLEAFVGPAPVGHQCCHNDGDKSNNNLLNLRWDTASSNNLDKNEHGTAYRGEAHHKAKLTEDDVLDIREAAAKGETHSSIARRYGVHHSNVSFIVRGDTWKHVGNNEVHAV